jgi:hypothetical protein
VYGKKVVSYTIIMSVKVESLSIAGCISSSPQRSVDYVAGRFRDNEQSTGKLPTIKHFINLSVYVIFLHR